MIVTKDLILDKARLEDWRAMYRNVWSREESARYMFWSVTTNELDAVLRMERTIDFQKTHETWTVYDKSTMEAIGYAGVKRMDSQAYEESGICLGPHFAHRGYGSQILEALMDYAKKQGAQTFYYTCRPENRASIALAMRFGFAYVGREYVTNEKDGTVILIYHYKKDI